MQIHSSESSLSVDWRPNRDCFTHLDQHGNLSAANCYVDSRANRYPHVDTNLNGDGDRCCNSNTNLDEYSAAYRDYNANTDASAANRGS